MSSTTGTMTDSGEEIGDDDDADEEEDEDEFNDYDYDYDDDNEWSSCFEIPVETILACLSV